MKVLLISHNALSKSTANGNVLCHNFQKFQDKEICQLYFQNEFPTEHSNSHFIRITDKNRAKSFFKGCSFEKIKPQNYINQNIKSSRKFFNLKNRPFFRLIREFVWKHGKFDYESLYRWVEEEKPTCIVYMPGASIFSIDICIDISKKFNLPIILYFTEDEFFHKYSVIKIFEFIFRNRLRKAYLKLFDSTKGAICIHGGLREMYSKFIKNENVYTVLMGCDTKIRVVDDKKTIKNFLYAGNVDRGRVDTLKFISKILLEINEDYTLQIIPSSATKKQIKILKKLKNINVFDFLPYAEYKEIINNADCLLLIETFKKRYINLVRSTFTGKLADYLNAPTPLLIFCPDYIYTCGYLRKAGFNVCSDLTRAKEYITSYVKIFEKSYGEYIKFKLAFGEKYHSVSKNSVEFMEILSKYEN